VESVRKLIRWLGERGNYSVEAHLYSTSEVGWQAQSEYDVETDLESAGVVLVVCTPNMRLLLEGKANAGQGFPILPDNEGNEADIPPALRARWNNYWFPSGYERIFDLTKAVIDEQTLKIFISYRREGDAGQAGRIADLLKNEFGADHVFMDVDAMRLGFDFVDKINEEVDKCDVLLAVMGRNWLDAQSDDGKRRLDDAADFVRLEIAAALQRKIPVIPILVDGTNIPPADRLPEDLQGLARRHALDLRNASFRADMDRLVQDLKAIKGL
jgi:hypothetical protein